MFDKENCIAQFLTKKKTFFVVTYKLMQFVYLLLELMILHYKERETKSACANHEIQLTL